MGAPSPKDWKPTSDRPADAGPAGFREGVSVEDTSARTAYTTEFVNPDGSRTRKVFQEVAFVPDAAGRMSKVDPTLRSSSRDGRLEPTTTLSPASFSPSAAAADMVRLDPGDGVSIGFGVEGAAPVTASVAADTATYRGLRPGADLTLTVTTFGAKDEIVLRSPSAPTSWVFPLRTLGVTPQWDEASKSIKLIDRRGNIAALIPPGFMADSSFDTRTGAPATSTGVTYTLLPRGAGWALQVDLDQAWLADPARVWPVTVDPTLQFWSEQDDTFVSYRDWANQNNSSSSDLLIGTYDWGGEVSESYLHFDYAMSQLANKYVTSASLSLYNYWSYSCTPSAASVHAVGQSWAGWSATSWNSRPGYSATALDTQSFANGYTGCAQGPNWATWNIPDDQMRAWAFGQVPFYGFVVRASYTDALGWKRFRSSNYSNQAYWPVLSVTYTVQPAGVLATSPVNDGVVDSLTPTLWVRPQNPTNAPVLQYQFKICSPPQEAPTNCHESSSWSTSPTFAVPSGWLSGWSKEQLWWVNIDNGSAPSGYLGPYWFTPVIAQPGVTSHLAGAPEGADLAGVNPQVGNFTTSKTDASVAVAGPALSVTRTYNSQDLRTNGAFGPGWSTPWDQRVEPDGDESGSVVVTLESGRQVRFGQSPGGSGYSPPPGMNLDLVYTASPATWTLRDPTGSTRVFDGVSGRLTSVTDVDGQMQTYGYTVPPAQGPNLALNKTTTSSTPCNANETGAKAVNGTVNGGASDKWCSGTGWRNLQVDLGSTQTVSSVIIRHAGAGGETMTNNSRNFTVAVNTDGWNWTYVAAVTGSNQSVTTVEFAPIPARWVQLMVTAATQGGDANARIYEFEVYGGTSSNARWLNTVTDVASGRALHVGWTGNVISTVDTDVPAVGELAQHWSYTYTTGRLASVCTPLRAGACSSYTYTASSHYRSVVLDASPTGYWSLGETSGSVAANMAARTTGQDGTYNAVSLNNTGALNGWPDKSVYFSQGSGSSVALPSAMLSSARNMAVEAWFKAPSGTSGNLVAEQNAAGTYWAPLLYVGTDGKLRGMVPVAANVGPLVLGGGGLCMEAAGGSWANGTALVTAVCTSSNAQRVRSYPDGTLRIFDRCLDIVGANPASMTHIQLHDCHGNWNQIWQPQGWGGLRNPGSGLCLDFDGSTAGAPAVIYGCTDYWAQYWSIPAVTAPMASTSTVTDLQWHHAVLTAGSAGQTLYLDGVAQATITGPVVDHRDADTAFIGNGKSNPGLPGSPGAGSAANAGNFAFVGYIDEVAYYRHPLAESDVKEHMGARGGSVRLTTVEEPVAGVATTVTSIAYNHATGRINTLADRNGATWTLGAPTVAANARTVRLSNNAATVRTIDYTYDTQHNGRITARAEAGGGTRFWAYNDDKNGFVKQTVDENANVVNYTTDDRGNVTQRQTCRAAGDCQNQYFGYWPAPGTPLDKLDPRTDVQIWSTDARGDATGTTYRTTVDINTAGRVVQITYPKPNGQSANPFEAFFYTTAGAQPAGLLDHKVDRNGKTTQYGYNTAGDLTTVTDPVGLLTTNGYDNLGRVRSITRSDGATSYGTTTITYNGLSLPETTTAPAITNDLATPAVTHQAKTTLAYNDIGQPTSQTIDDIAGGDPDRVTTWQYDTAGRLRFTTNPDGTIVEQRWNTAGDMTDKILPTGLWQLYSYDYAHRLTLMKAKGAAGVDPEDPNNTADVLLDSRSYDAAGRLTAVVDAKNRTTRYVYYGDNLPMDTIRVVSAGPPEVTLTTEHRTYDAAGHVAALTVPGPNTSGATTQTSYTYDAAGNLQTQALDPTGLNRVTTTSYNKDSSIAYTTATGSASPGRTDKVEYTYDDAGRVLTASTVDTVTLTKLTTTAVRDKRGLVIQETDPSVVDTFHSYDNLGQLHTTTGEARTTWVNGASTSTAPVTTLGYNTFGETTHQRDPNGNVTVTTYDLVGHLVTVTKPAYTPPGGTTITPITTTHYTNGLADSVTDPRGNVTTVGYDKFGRIITGTDPDPDGAGPKTSPQWTYKYNRDGELVETTLPTGAKTGAEYNTLGRKIKDSETENNAAYWWDTLLEYDDAGNQISAKTPEHQYVATTSYNKAGEVTKVTDHTGRFAETRYDLAGRAAYTVSGRNATYVSPGTSTGYDFAGRATTTSDCAVDPSTGACTSTLRTTSASYNDAGRILSQTSAENRPTTYTYDNGGQLTAITQRVEPANPATAITVGLGYDPVGNKTRMVDGTVSANTTIYTYNTWNLPESVIEPSTVAHSAASDRTWTTSYNANGLPVHEQLPGAVSRTKTYDNLGRLTAETGTGATTTARSLDYDALGRITGATSPAGDHTYTWTDRGQLASATGYGGNVTLTYNGEALLTQQIDTTGTATLTYDEGGRLKTISDPLTATTVRNEYDDAGRLSTTDHGPGTALRTYTYDPYGRIDTDSTPAAASIDYGYDLDDLLTSKTTTETTGAGLNSYTYDGLSRLASWLSPAGQTTAYGYDAASNRTTVTTPAGTRTSTYDARNRRTATTGAGGSADSYTWNPRGQLTGMVQNGQSTNYTYDAFERLTQVTGSATPTTSYTYDSLDRVAQRNLSNFGYHDLTNNPVSSPSAAGETKLLRDPLGAALAAKTGSAAGTVLLGDPLHDDTVATANPTTGALAASASYDPWGAQTTSGAVPLGYQGGYTDPDTGLTNAHARWYNPTLGAFTSRDTWTLQPSPVPQVNRYVYANGSPMVMTDPEGNEPGSWCPNSACAVLNGQTQTSHPMDSQVVDGAVVQKAAPVIDAAIYNTAYLLLNGACPETYAAFGCLDQTNFEEFRPMWDPAASAPLASAGESPTRTPIQVACGAQEMSMIGCAPGTVTPVPGYCANVVGYEQTLACMSDGGPSQGQPVLAVLALTAMFGLPILLELISAVGISALADAALFAFIDSVSDGALTASGMTAMGIGAMAAESGAATKLAKALGAACSFSPDTPVLMADGSTKPIETVEPADTVTATDPTTRATTPAVVTATHQHLDEELTDLAVTGPDQHSSVVHTTPNHPFWSVTRQAWIQAGNLLEGEELRTPDGSTPRVVAVTAVTGSGLMYNLTVGDVHTYYVVAGNTPVLVHNTGPCDHVLLGKSQGLDTTAAKIDARTLMSDPNWQKSVLDAIANPGTRISVSLDGVTGTSIYSKVMGAAQRGASTNGTPFDWEMAQLYNSGALGRVTFYEGGKVVANPFG